MRIIKRASEFVGWILSFIFPASAPMLLRATVSHAYTGFFKRHFAAIGKDTVIAYRAGNLKGLGMISIGEHTRISADAQLTAWEKPGDKRPCVKIRIGNNCNLRNGIHITAVNGITIGDNLLVYPWMSELVRVNKSIIVYRNMPMMKTLEEAHRLSGYINHALRDKNRSVWIAQREGRAKNSDDRTQESVIKMLAFEGEGDIRHNVEALHIVPVSISYEYDPCDYLKAREFQLKRDNPEFRKSPKDDLNSMSTGLLGKKGNIRFTISGSISDEAAKLPCHLKRAEYFTAVAGIMDRRIHQGYCMFSGNYVAYDLLTGTEQFAGKYTEAEKQKFQDYLEGQLSKIDNLPNPDYKYLRTKILEMYANPLRNKMAVSDMP